MKKMIIAAFIATVLGTSAGAYDVEGIYNNGMVPKSGTVVVDNLNSYIWDTDESTHQTWCEVIDNDGYTYSYVWDNAEEYDNETVYYDEPDSVGTVVYSYEEVFIDENRNSYGVENGVVEF